MSLDSLTIKLLLKSNTFNTSLTKSVEKLKDAQKAANALSNSARTMFLGLAAAATGAVAAFSTFEFRMDRVLAISGATASEFAELTEVARKLGRETVFTANQAAQAMAEFALQGFEANEVVAAMPGILDLAIIGQTGVANAARIGAGVLRVFNLEASEMTRVVNVLAKSATTSATTVSLMGSALRQLGPIASQVGFSLEETVGLLSIFSNVMIRGGMAGTALRNILQRLTKQYKEVREALDLANVSVVDQEGRFRSLPDIVDSLNESFKGLTRIQRQQIIVGIAGQRAQAAFGELLRQGGDAIRDYIGRLEEIEDESRRISGIMQDNLFSSFKKLISAATDLGIEMGGLASGPLQSVIDALRDMINWLTKSDDTFKTVMGTMGLFAFAASGVAVAIKSITGSLIFLGGTFLGVTGQLKNLAIWIGLGATQFFTLARGAFAAGTAFGIAEGIVAALSGTLSALLSPLAVFLGFWGLAALAIGGLSIAIYNAGQRVVKLNAAFGDGTGELDEFSKASLKEAEAAQRTSKAMSELNDILENGPVFPEEELAAREKVVRSMREQKELLELQHEAFAATSDDVQAIEDHAKSTKKHQEAITKQIQEQKRLIAGINAGQEERDRREANRAKNVKDFVKDLKLQAATLGMSTLQAKLFKLQLEGVTPEEQKSLDIALAKLEASKEAKRIEDEREAQDKRRQDAEQKFEDNRFRDFQKAIADAKKANELLKKNLSDLSFRESKARGFITKRQELERKYADAAKHSKTAVAQLVDAELAALEAEEDRKKIATAAAAAKSVIDARTQVTASFEGIESVFKRIQSAAASGPDQAALRAKEALAEARKGNGLTIKQTQTLDKIRDDLRNVGVMVK